MWSSTLYWIYGKWHKLKLNMQHVPPGSWYPCTIICGNLIYTMMRLFTTTKISNSNHKKYDWSVDLSCWKNWMTTDRYPQLTVSTNNSLKTNRYCIIFFIDTVCNTTFGPQTTINCPLYQYSSTHILVTLQVNYLQRWIYHLDSSKYPLNNIV
jgi:hypothetical protein